MKTNCFILITLITTLGMRGSYAQFSRQQADNLVLNQILSDNTGKVNVYVASDIKTGSQAIMLFDGEAISLPYSSNYVYFVDDYPVLNWCHPCRLIFVNTIDGTYTIIQNNKYPHLLNNDYTCIASIPRAPYTPKPTAHSTWAQGAPPNPHQYAVLICGAENPNGSEDRFWYNTSAIYFTLINVYGFTMENIFVHYVNGTGGPYDNNDLNQDGTQDIDYDARKTTIHRTFQELAGETDTVASIPQLGPDDQLFVYVTDHGGWYNNHASIYIKMGPYLPYENLFDYELAAYMQNINCASMIFMMQQCHSGGFVDDLLDYTTYNVACKNRSIHTACRYEELSGANFYIPGNGELLYDEFSFYWTAAARKFYPDIEEFEPWDEGIPIGSFPFNTYLIPPPTIPADYNPDINNDGFVQMEEAFNYANYMNSWTPNGYFKPYYPECPANPVSAKNTGFVSDVLTINGYAGTIDTMQTVPGRKYKIAGNMDIIPGAGLNLMPKTLFSLEVPVTLTIQNNGALTLQDSVIFVGAGEDTILCQGTMSVGNNVQLCTDILIRGTMQLQPGANLYLTNGAKVTVLPGGKLIVPNNAQIHGSVGVQDIVNNGTVIIGEDAKVHSNIITSATGMVELSAHTNGNPVFTPLAGTQIQMQTGSTLKLNNGRVFRITDANQLMLQDNVTLTGAANSALEIRNHYILDKNINLEVLLRIMPDCSFSLATGKIISMAGNGKIFVNKEIIPDSVNTELHGVFTLGANSSIINGIVEVSGIINVMNNVTLGTVLQLNENVTMAIPAGNQIMLTSGGLIKVKNQSVLIVNNNSAINAGTIEIYGQMEVKNSTISSNINVFSNGNLQLEPSCTFNYNGQGITINNGSNVNMGHLSTFNGTKCDVYGNMILAGNGSLNLNLAIKAGGALQIPANGKLNILDLSYLLIEHNANFNIGANSEIIGNNNKYISILGNFNIGGPLAVKAVAGAYFKGIQYENGPSILNLSQLTFTNADFKGFCNVVNLNNSSFNSGNFGFSTNQISINNCSFSNTPVIIKKGSVGQPEAIISNCNFINYQGDAVLQLEGIYNYTISNNQIYNNISNGIALYNCGGSIGNHIISNNNIYNNTKQGVYGDKNKPAGIRLYNSIANIENNKIKCNTNGVVCLNNSNVKLIGNEEAQTTDQTQLIKDNELNQVFATDNSFPCKFRYNAIYSLNTEHFPFLEVAYTQPLHKTFDVAYNYWGSYFDPQYDFMPAGAFRYDPIWELHESGGGEEEAAMMFDNAQQQINNGNYAIAESTLKQITATYPESHYAKASLKELFALTEVNGADYMNLQGYLQQQHQQQTDHDLKKLANALANGCNIKMQHYPEAIQFFENIIENPETLADSIFAVIDAGYVYLLLNGNGENKSINNVGKISAIVPKDMASYKNTRNNLINALFGESKPVPPKKEIQNPISNMTAMEVLVYPNPADDNISVTLPTAKIYSGCIILFDVLGQKVYEQPYNEQHLQIDIKHLKSGFYNIVIKNDNNSLTSKKINIVR